MESHSVDRGVTIAENGFPEKIGKHDINPVAYGGKKEIHPVKNS
jgi:hypothetical protein